MNQLQQTIIDNSLPQNRADLHREDFDKLVVEKGGDAVIEAALVCPCKGNSTQQLSNCKNCGGTGWVFINPTSTRVILTGIDVSTKLMPWSSEARGMVSITALPEEQLSYMDRITMLNGISIFSEVVTLRVNGSDVFAFTAYRIKEIIVAAIFVNENTKLTKLTASQYTIVGNLLKITDSSIIGGVISLRYKHCPSFHIVEFKRETMQSFKLEDGNEILQQFPVHGYARRAHYVLDAQNLGGTRLIDNSDDATDNNSTFREFSDEFSSEFN